MTDKLEQHSEDAVRANIKFVLDKVLWTSGAAEQNKDLLADAIAKKLCGLAARNEWQDISTAPKDGSAILLASKGRVCDGFWKPQTEYGNGCWVWCYVRCEPTHWQPTLLSPPEET